MKIGDRVYVHGYIDEIRNDTIIIRNDGGYFGTVASEIVSGDIVQCSKCRFWQSDHLCRHWSRYGTIETMPTDYCSYGERKDDIE